MQKNKNGENIPKKSNKFIISLNELTDHKTVENSKFSDIYEEYGDKRDKTRDYKNKNGISMGGRYTNGYIHYLIANSDLKKFVTSKK